MKWSFKLAQFAGIDLKVHVTFFLILIIGAMHWSSFGWPGMGFGVSLMVLLFACVTLHEFGHALVAQRYGIPVREIILLPIGGVALLGRNPDKPMQELLIALAGPAVNVVIAIALGLYLALYAAAGNMTPQAFVELTVAGPSWMTLLVWLFNANVVIVLFNMIPAFPLDGGRVLRALLGFVMPWGRATAVAATTGQVMAVLLGLGALLIGNMILAVIAIFIFMAAGSTRADEQSRAILSTRRIGDAYNRYALELNESDTISRVVDYLLTSYQPDFAVLRRGELVGVVSRDQALLSLARSPVDESVGDVVTRDVVGVDARVTLEEVKRLMEEKQTRLVAVYDHGRYLGLVSAEDLAEALVIISYERRRASATAPMEMPDAYPRPA